jgi:predicted secreted hydrolase
MSIQLEDNTELMLFRLRMKDGSVDPFSAGTHIDAAGRTQHLESGDFDMEPVRKWKDYPIEWNVRIPRLDLVLRAITPMEDQELVSRSGYSPTYWEGAMDFEGERSGRKVRGLGYLEMTGYAAPLAAVPAQAAATE